MFSLLGQIKALVLQHFTFPLRPKGMAVFYSPTKSVDIIPLAGTDQLVAKYFQVFQSYLFIILCLSFESSGPLL